MLGQCGRPSIWLLRTEEGDLTNCSDMARLSIPSLLNGLNTVAGIDDEAGQPIPNEQRTMVPQFKFTPVDESTVMDLLRNLDVHKATRCDKIQGP